MNAILRHSPADELVYQFMDKKHILGLDNSWQVLLVFLETDVLLLKLIYR